MLPEALSLKMVTSIGKMIRIASCKSTWPRSRKKMRQRRDSKVKSWLENPGKGNGSVSMAGIFDRPSLACLRANMLWYESRCLSHDCCQRSDACAARRG